MVNKTALFGSSPLHFHFTRFYFLHIAPRRKCAFKSAVGISKVLFILLVLWADTSLGSVCDASLNSSKALQRIEQLDPALFKNASTALSKDDLLILLKERIWELLPNGSIPWKNKIELSESLKSNLHEQFNKSFRMDEMSEDNLYLFYANQLRSIYYLLLREWMEEKVTEEATEELTSFTKNFGLALMSRSLATAGLLSDTFNPELTRETLGHREWKDFPWKEAFQMAKEWNELGLSVQELSDWINSHSIGAELKPSHRSAVERALRYPGFANPCCLTDPGCLLCPNNRSWLRKPKPAAGG